MSANTYDELPYPSASFPQSHPVRLATMAHLFGLSPTPPDHSHVLELGCADGANLIPLAQSYPQSTFVGLDLSARQIESGQRVIREVGLTNIELRQGDIRLFDAGDRPFDYIIVHGIFSWVPDDVRESILTLCHRFLAPQGVAYISYNTLPGWHMRGMIRQMMLYHTSELGTTAGRIEQSRALVRFLAESVPTEGNPYGQFLRSELAAMETWQDGYLRHDLLEDDNRAFYFHDFIAQAGRHGLQYLSEPDLSSMLAGNLTPAVQSTLAGISRDLIAMEQYMDFLRNRSFRMTLLVHQGIRLERGLDPRKVRPCWFGATAQPVSPTPDPRAGVRETFRLANGATFSSESALFKAVMCTLHDALPNGLHYGELVTRVRARLAPLSAPSASAIGHDREEEAICQQLLMQYGSGLIDLTSAPWVSCGRQEDPAPATTALMRHQARHDPRHVTNLRHLCVPIDGFSRQVIDLLNGSRSTADVAAVLARRILDGEFRIQDSGGESIATEPELIRFLVPKVESVIKTLAQRNFLIASPAQDARPHR